ncbi:beta-galactosidase [Streptomyces sp. NBC_01485]|uniref:hypothetical protein n=1 Tax=Streptomyces sp. NBC_01485 TaxID=2903884 RepID=UPI002E2F4461|nr:hypothetical protein [Streptomyces sp. NBC_01485]
MSSAHFGATPPPVRRRPRLPAGRTAHWIASAAIHYFRVHPDLRSDRLTRLWAMSVNTAETYVT